MLEESGSQARLGNLTEVIPRCSAEFRHLVAQNIVCCELRYGCFGGQLCNLPCIATLNNPLSRLATRSACQDDPIKKMPWLSQALAGVGSPNDFCATSVPSASCRTQHIHQLMTDSLCSDISNVISRRNVRRCLSFNNSPRQVPTSVPCSCDRCHPWNDPIRLSFADSEQPQVPSTGEFTVLQSRWVLLAR